MILGHEHKCSQGGLESTLGKKNPSLLENINMNKRISKHHYQKKDRRQEIEQLQTHLDDLITDRASMEIVYHSLKNAYVIYPESAEWEEVDKEICRAYDDLMAQVRQLDRQLKRLDRSMKLAAVSNPQP